MLPVYGTFDEKSATEGHIEGTTNQEGEADTVTVYLFLAKIRCLSEFWNAKQRYTIDLQPVYCTSVSLRYIQQQYREEDTDIPFTVTVYHSMAKITEVFHFVLVLQDVFSF